MHISGNYVDEKIVETFVKLAEVWQTKQSFLTPPLKAGLQVA